MLFSLPKEGDPAWSVRRKLAVYCLRIIVLITVWILILATIAVFMDRNLKDIMSGVSPILMICIPSLAGVVAKYINDASKDPIK